MTEFNTQTTAGDYRLQFKTDDKDKFLFMQEQARKCIDDERTASVAPVVHAHWIDKTEDTRREYVCSKCERSVFLQFSHAIKEEPALLQVMYPYCHCGARMDEEVE